MGISSAQTVVSKYDGTSKFEIEALEYSSLKIATWLSHVAIVHFIIDAIYGSL